MEKDPDLLLERAGTSMDKIMCYDHHWPIFQLNIHRAFSFRIQAPDSLTNFTTYQVTTKIYFETMQRQK